MKKEKKEKFIDDGRTIFNMDIDGFKWHDKKKKESIYVDKDDKKSIIKAAYKAYIPMFLMVVLGFTLAMILVYLWLR